MVVHSCNYCILENRDIPFCASLSLCAYVVPYLPYAGSYFQTEYWCDLFRTGGLPHSQQCDRSIFELSIASRDITEESKPFRVVLSDLACVISFNIIHSPEHPIVLGLPWFELHNPQIDWRKRVILESKKNHISNFPIAYNPNLECHQISTISLENLRKEGQKEEMFIFAIITMPTPTQQKSTTLLPTKYQEFQDVFNKDKASRLPEHRP